MSPAFQSFIVFLFIAGALGFFARRWWRGRKSGGCSGGCCPAASHKPEITFRQADGGREGGATHGSDS